MAAPLGVVNYFLVGWVEELRDVALTSGLLLRNPTICSKYIIEHKFYNFNPLIIHYPPGDRGHLYEYSFVLFFLGTFIYKKTICLEVSVSKKYHKMDLAFERFRKR